MMHSIVAVAFLLGVAATGEVRAQFGIDFCPGSNITPSPRLNYEKFTAGDWYLQEIIYRRAEDVQKAQVRCYRETYSLDYLTYTVSDSWKNVTNGAVGSSRGIMGTNSQNPAVWYVYSEQFVYSGVWTVVDPGNSKYAMQHYCPEDAGYGAEKMLLFTRARIPNPLHLALMEARAAASGFPKRNAVRVNNLLCSW